MTAFEDKLNKYVDRSNRFIKDKIDLKRTHGPCTRHPESMSEP